MVTQPDGTTAPLAIGVPGDREVDLTRLEAQLEPAQVRVFTDADFAERPHLVKGYIGPGAIGEQKGVRYLVDPRVVDGSAWVTGADAPNRHVIDLVAGRDFQPDGTIDVAEVRVGDPCPTCGAGLELRRGIEIGHIFQLGQKYARALALEVAGPDGRPVVPTMGSYGIGVSRAVAAIAESTHDESGLCWPREVSPADLHLVAVGTEDPVVQVSEQLASDLAEAGIRVLYDDRAGVSAGVKFKDAELIGVPTVVVVGKALADGQVEVRDRRSRTTSMVPAATAADHLIELVAGG